MSVKDAKAQLMTLVTKIMMEEAGFIINEVFKDCKRKTDFLKIKMELHNKYQDNINNKASKINELRSDADDAKRKLIKALQEELKGVLDEDDERKPNALRVLMQIVTANNTATGIKLAIKET